jgi:alpha-glucosidase (family GH31 glycosyl hydrolase)
MQLRASLVPYTYTSARRAFDTGIAIVSPLYFYWPELEQSFAFRTQYMFGTETPRRVRGGGA